MPLPTADGYAFSTSVVAGGTLGFALSCTPQNSVEIRVYRLGTPIAQYGKTVTIAVPARVPPAGQPWVNGFAWPLTYSLATSTTWPSGAYYLEMRVSGNALRRIAFAVRAAPAAAPKSIIFVLPLATDQAYNAAGGGSLYASGPQAPRVSFLRPLAYTGAFDVYIRPTLLWLEAQGYSYDCCTSVDLHAVPDILTGHRIVLSIGHDEYWSKEMRDRVEQFVGNGGHFVNLGGDTCRWQVRFESANQVLVGYKENAAADPIQTALRTGLWRDTPPGRSDDSLQGTSSMRGGGWWNPAPIAHPGFKILAPDHWLLSGTGLQLNDDVGSGTTPSTDLVGYETNSCYYVDNASPRTPWVDAGTGLPEIPAFGKEDRFIILGTADLRASYGTGGPSGIGGPGFATFGFARKFGTIFDAAVTNWGVHLDPTRPSYAVVSQVTQNLLSELHAPMPALPPLLNTGFEDWAVASHPDHWSSEGAGTLQRYTADKINGLSCIQVNGTLGATWSSQTFVAEGYTYYRIGAWVKCNTANGAYILLQDTNVWVDFASSVHPGNNAWVYLCGVGRVMNLGATFGARAKVQVAAGVTAYFDDLRVDFA